MGFIGGRLGFRLGWKRFVMGAMKGNRASKGSGLGIVVIIFNYTTLK